MIILQQYFNRLQECTWAKQPHLHSTSVRLSVTKLEAGGQLHHLNTWFISLQSPSGQDLTQTSSAPGKLKSKRVPTQSKVVIHPEDKCETKYTTFPASSVKHTIVEKLAWSFICFTHQ